MADAVVEGGTRDAARPAVEDASTVQLLTRASEQVSVLVRQEIALARTEITTRAKVAGAGAGMLVAAGLVALLGAGALVATAVVALDLVLATWLAALVVTIVLLAVAGVLALVGTKALGRATPPVQHTVESIRRDVDTIKGNHRDHD